MIRFLLLVSCFLVTAVTQADERPNVVLIMCDDMGYSDIGAYGGEVETPNLDRLAAGGIRFRNFYNNAKCEHTRSSLLTGEWWIHNGAHDAEPYLKQTIGERLTGAGYTTLMAGKWHAGETPYERGFQRYYGLTDGCCNFWNPGHARPGEPEPAKKKPRRWATDAKKFLPYTPEDPDFYTTDAFTSAAIEFLDEEVTTEKPFFLYLAYTAPHYPLHASKEEVAKYQEFYETTGWDELRRQRYQRQKKLGVITPSTPLPPTDPDIPEWASLSQTEKADWAMRMAAYAAMIDRMDRQIGRVMKKLDEMKASENTLILFLSDNGAEKDSADRSTVKGAKPWEVTSYLTQGKPWAHASNTPFSGYKMRFLEGGCNTPFFAHWPAGIQEAGWTDQVGHIVDIVPTLLDLAQADTPKTLPGISLTDSLTERKTSDRPPLYWAYRNDLGMRRGPWKIVKTHKQPWQLFHLKEDPTEITDLANEKPEVKDEMVALWEAWWDTRLEGLR